MRYSMLGDPGSPSQISIRNTMHGPLELFPRLSPLNIVIPDLLGVSIPGYIVCLLGTEPFST